MVFARISLASVCFLALLATYMTAQPSFSDWSAAVNLGPAVNSASNDGSPALSKDGLSLYFASDRTGQHDIWVSHRNSEEDPWESPSNLGAVINTTFTEFHPTLSRDGHWLFFQSNRTGSFVPGLDIWASYREDVHDDFSWQPAVHAGPGVNAPGLDTGPSFFENDDVGIPQLFFASNRNIGSPDIYVSDLLPDGSFGPGIRVPELSGPGPDPGLSVRFDGLEVFLFSIRSGSLGGFDLWTSTRETVFEPWSLPANLGPLVNSTANDQSPHIAPDRQTLYFQSIREGGSGNFDLYVSTRTRQNH